MGVGARGVYVQSTGIVSQGSGMMQCQPLQTRVTLMNRWNRLIRRRYIDIRAAQESHSTTKTSIYPTHLRPQSNRITRKSARTPDVSQSEEQEHDTLETDTSTCVRRCTVAEGLDVVLLTGAG